MTRQVKQLGLLLLMVLLLLAGVVYEQRPAEVWKSRGRSYRSVVFDPPQRTDGQFGGLQAQTVIRGEARAPQQLLLADVKLGPDLAATPADQQARSRISQAIDELAHIPGESLIVYLAKYHSQLLVTGSAGRRSVVDERLLSHLDPILYLQAQGPAAVPLLLERLADSTPTKAVQHFSPGVDRFLQYKWPDCNPADEYEIKLAKDLAPNSDDVVEVSSDNRSLCLTVGDVCGAILGSIVGRDYFTINGGVLATQGDFIVKLPARYPPAVAMLRKRWTDTSVRESLLLDYRARIDTYSDAGRNDRLPIPHRSRADRAAERMWLYFPEFILPDLIQRLDGLDASFQPDRGCWFLRHILWKDDESIRSALARLIDRTDDGGLLAEILESPILTMEDRERSLQICRDQLETVPPSSGLQRMQLTAAIACLLKHEPDGDRLAGSVRALVAAEPVAGIALVTDQSKFMGRFQDLWPIFRERLQDESAVGMEALSDDKAVRDLLNLQGVQAEKFYQIRDVVGVHLAARLSDRKLAYPLDRRVRARRERLRAELLRRGDMLAESSDK